MLVPGHDSTIQPPADVKPVPKIRAEGLPSSLLGPSSGPTPLSRLAIQKEIPVECCGIPGMFYFGEQKVKCECVECMAKPETQRIFTATHFEQHCGAGSAKKWKASVRIRPGSVPEVLPGEQPLPLGKWFVLKGIDDLVTRVPVAGRRREAKTKRPSAYDAGFEGLEGAHRANANPWDQVRVGGYMKIHVSSS